MNLFTSAFAAVLNSLSAREGAQSYPHWHLDTAEPCVPRPALDCRDINLFRTVRAFLGRHYQRKRQCDGRIEFESTLSANMGDSSIARGFLMAEFMQRMIQPDNGLLPPLFRPR